MSSASPEPNPAVHRSEPARTNGPRSAAVAALVLFLFAGPVEAAPTVKSVRPRGLRRANTTRITVEGAELGGAARVVLPVPIQAQKVVGEATPTKVSIDVTLGDVPQGIYPLWVATPGGLAGPAMVGIDVPPTLPFKSEAGPLPVALDGTLTGGTVLTTRLEGRAGDRCVVEIEARRLGAALNPVLRLNDPRGVQIAWAQASDALEGDARIETILPADGTYTVTLQDALRRGAAPGHFRLKLGPIDYADHVFPLAIERGGRATLELIGATRRELLTIDVSADGPPGPAALPWDFLYASGSRPTYRISPHAERVEPKGAPTGAESETLPGPPLGFSGRIDAPRQVDQLSFPVTPGAKLRFDLVARRIGSPLDGVLTIHASDGRQLATSDDRGDLVDPGMDITVPAGVESLRASVRGAARRGGPDYVYWLVVLPVGHPSVTLGAKTDRVVVPVEGTAFVSIGVERDGYAGPLQLAAEGLPAHVEVSGLSIAAGATQALLALTATGGAAPGDASIARMVATAPATDTAPAAGADQAWPVFFAPPAAPALPAPRDRQLAVGLIGPAPLSIAWDNLPDDMPDDARLVPGTPLVAALRLVRRDAGDGPVRVRLVTDQIIPKKTVKKDKKDVQVDDVARAVRLEGTPRLAAGQTTLDVKILVPADLPARPYLLALEAELLSADGKTVRAKATSRPRRLDAVAAPAPAESAPAAQK